MSYDRIQKLCTDLEGKIQQLDQKIEQIKRPADQEILDDVELCARLNVSKRTTATWRALRMIPHSVIGGKIYYVYSDVLAFIKNYAVPTLDGSLKIKLSGRA